jgi:5-enolpyruvylshikimate-3-phosphate synthase
MLVLLNERTSIKILVDALKQLDAKIDYEKKRGFPQLKSSEKKITKIRFPFLQMLVVNIFLLLLLVLLENS